MDDFDAYLGEYVYDKIWEELSDNDRKAILAIAQSENGRIEEIRKLSGMGSNELSVYRSRLLRKGIISSTRYGYLELVLPRFREYLLNYIEYIV